MQAWILCGIAQGWIAGAIPARLVLHPSRRRIVRILQERPGVGVTEMCLALQLNRGTLLHHLRLLERAGHVRPVLAGKERLYFLRKQVEGATEALSALLRGRALHVAVAVQDSPGIMQKELAVVVDISRKVIRGHLDLLTQNGLVREETHGRKRRYWPTPALERILPLVRWRASDEGRRVVLEDDVPE